MKRTSIALAAFGVFLVSPATAANLIHPTAATKSVQRGVTVWKGAAPLAAATLPETAEGRRCRETITIAIRIGNPPRRLRTHGFWSGRAPGPLSYSVATSGFFADRIAAGL